jgi:predicted metalloprotease with PDZ domain
MVGIMPYVQAALGSSAWFTPGKLAQLGIPRFLKLYRGCEGTYAWLLYQIDQEYSQRSIGEAIQVVLAGQDTRVADIREFMTTLGAKINDAKYIRRIAAAFPTPLDHTLFGVAGWRDLGARPNLDEMFASNAFTIKTVEPGSIAKSLGFRPGDRILTIDGFNPARDKAQCLRSLLKKERGQPVTFIVQRSRLQQRIVMAVE